MAFFGIFKGSEERQAAANLAAVRRTIGDLAKQNWATLSQARVSERPEQLRNIAVAAFMTPLQSDRSIDGVGNIQREIKLAESQAEYDETSGMRERMVGMSLGYRLVAAGHLAQRLGDDAYPDLIGAMASVEGPLRQFIEQQLGTCWGAIYAEDFRFEEYRRSLTDQEIAQIAPDW